MGPGRTMRSTRLARLAESAEFGLARRGRGGSWVRGSRGLVAAGCRTGGDWLRVLSALPLPPGTPSVAGPARRLAPSGRAHPTPRTRRPGPPPSPQPAGRDAGPAAAQADEPWRHDEPSDDHPWAGPAPDVPEAMILDLIEEVLGACPSMSTAGGCIRGGGADVGPDPAEPAALPTRTERAATTWPRGGQAGRHARPGLLPHHDVDPAGCPSCGQPAALSNSPRRRRREWS